MKAMKLIPSIIYPLAVLIAAIGAVAFFSYNEEPLIETPPAPKYSPFDTISIAGKSAIVYIPDTEEILFKKEAYTALPLASVTKLITAYASSKILLNDEVVTIDYNDLLPEGEVGLEAGDRWKAEDIRDIMLVSSSNDAAEALGRTSEIIFQNKFSTSSSFISYINNLVKDKGLKSLRVESYSGLDIEDTVPTSFGSAYDIARLIKYILIENPEILDATRQSSIERTSLQGFSQTFNNTNLTIDQIPTILGSKTGFTDTAGGNVAFVFSNGLNTPVIIVILGSIDQETRFGDAMELVRATERYMRLKDYNNTEINL